MNKRYPGLGRIVIADRVIDPQSEKPPMQTVILLLTACVALMMTGFGIIMPVFARRLTEFGDGVEALGLMTTSFALAQFISAPLFGSVADQRGRRPVILLAIGAFVFANIGYLVAESTLVFILIRAAGGFFTAGLFPAAMGVVSDTIPEGQRARWIGFIMGGYGAGFVFGPVLGGILYDLWGFAAPFLLSAGMALLAFIAAVIMVPETRPAEIRKRDYLRKQWQTDWNEVSDRKMWQSLPKPLYIFLLLLFLDFIYNFSFAYVEPQMVFYFYDFLKWSTAQFGIVVGVYSIAMVIGQVGLGSLSDRFGRKPIILIGLVMNSTLYAGLAVLRTFGWMAAGSLLAGLGAALFAPALSAYILDVTREEYRSRVVGMKESALALGGVFGPLAVVGMARFVDPQGIFWTAFLIMAVSTILAAVLLKEPQHLDTREDNVNIQVSNRRAIAAQATLRGIVLRARASRLEAD